MAQLDRYALTTQHKAQQPLGTGELAVSGQTAGNVFAHAELMIRGDHRYILRLDQTDSIKVAGWLAYLLRGDLKAKADPAADLRNLANMIEADSFPA